MKKHQIKNNPSAFSHSLLKKGDSLKKQKAFTLVELIIVITILAVLATIAFVSFSSYTASSRDTKRIVTIESISKGLNIFQTQTGKYPNIDNQSSTGVINSDTLSFVGEVGDNVSKLINISPTPKDPVSGNNFKYATSFDNKYFQVAGTQEKPVAEKSIINQSYANSRQAKVLGNYNGLLKYGSKLYNLPSLLYTGSGYLISNSTYFIVDKGQNIPYKISSTDPDNSVQTSVILSQLTGTSSVSLTGITLPSTPGELKANIDSVVQILGYPGDKIGQESFGTPYFIASSSLSSGGSVTPWSCGNPLTVNIGGTDFTYTTKLLADGKCWTTQNMRHTVSSCLTTNSADWANDTGKCGVGSTTNMSSAFTDTLSDTNTYGLYYQWSLAPQVCSALGNGWALPTDNQWSIMETAYTPVGPPCTANRNYGECWGAGWDGTQALGGLTTQLSGARYGNGTFTERGDKAVWWMDISNGATYGWVRMVGTFGTVVIREDNDFVKGAGVSVVCIKN